METVPRETFDEDERCFDSPQRVTPTAHNHFPTYPRRSRLLSGSKDHLRPDCAPLGSRSVRAPTIFAKLIPETTLARSTGVFHVKRWRWSIELRVATADQSSSPTRPETFPRPLVIPGGEDHQCPDCAPTWKSFRQCTGNLRQVYVRNNLRKIDGRVSRETPAAEYRASIRHDGAIISPTNHAPRHSLTLSSSRAAKIISALTALLPGSRSVNAPAIFAKFMSGITFARSTACFT